MERIGCLLAPAALAICLTISACEDGGVPCTDEPTEREGISLPVSLDPSSFGFFVFSDMHAARPFGRFATSVAQMLAIDPVPLAGLATGDFTDSATSAQWACNLQIVRRLLDPAAPLWGDRPRYLGAPGNHDTVGANWFALWARSLPGQTGMGHSESDGIYFTTSYSNALFLFMDSNRTSGASTSWDDEQTRVLAATLAGSTAPFKFMFFHRPVYSCYSGHKAFADGLPWIDLAEKYNVDAVFSGHTHVYTRSCRMHRGSCTDGAEGTVQVEVGTVGSSHTRSIDVRHATVTGTDSAGAARKDSYNCTSNLVASHDDSNSFCYVQINGCRATISCYLVEEGNATPFDTWTISHCSEERPA